MEICLLNHSPSSVVIWDEKHLKALLGLRRHPLRIVHVEPWQSWIDKRGGLIQVRSSLRSGPLSPIQRKLLDLILDHPDASVMFYCARLNFSQSTYFLYLSDLIQALLLQLNAWKLEPIPAREVALLTNLPAPLTPLVGAQETVAAVVAILQRPQVRLLTLMGPGGVGKTRLSIDVGATLLESFRDGVFFIPLESLSDPALLVPQIARSFHLENAGVQSLLDTFKSFLRTRQMLLILDNFEQLVAASALVTELLLAAAELKIMVTSREALHQYGESRFIVPELPRPDPSNLPPLEQLGQWAAINLFVQRVQALHPAFILKESNKTAIAQICFRLDGLPLAIELAAAQMKYLSPTQVLAHLERGLESLRDVSLDRPRRQKTIWDAIDWSYRLLPDVEKALFRRLAVFARAWGLDAAQAVCKIPDVLTGLENLADKSLVRYTPIDEENDLHFEMLQAVREYALDQLESSGEAENFQRAHATYYLEFVQQAERAIGTIQQPSWARRIGQEHENLQTVLQWMLDARETESVFRLLGTIWRYWDMLNVWSEARLWMERALTQGAGLQSAGRATTLWGASWLATHQSDYPLALSYAKEGLALAREIGEKRLVGRLLQSVADGLYRLGEHEQGITLIEESLDVLRELDDREEIAWALDHLARGVWQRGEHARSKELLRESLAIFRKMSHQRAVAASLRHLARLALEDDENDEAAGMLTESLSISREIGAKQLISEILRELAWLMWKQNAFDRARELLEEGLALSHEIGDRSGEGWALNLLGRLAMRESDFGAARQLFESAQRLFDESADSASISYNIECLKRLEMVKK